MAVSVLHHHLLLAEVRARLPYCTTPGCYSCQPMSQPKFLDHLSVSLHTWTSVFQPQGTSEAHTFSVCMLAWLTLNMNLTRVMFVDEISTPDFTLDCSMMNITFARLWFAAIIVVSTETAEAPNTRFLGALYGSHECYSRPSNWCMLFLLLSWKDQPQVGSP